MKKMVLATFALVALAGVSMPASLTSRAIPAEATPAYSAAPDWLKLPEGRTEIGSMHGTVAVSSANEVYINVEGTVRQRFAVLGPNPGLQVYSADGKYLRNVPNAPFDLHGFVIRKEADGEYIYATRLAAALTPADQTRAGLDQQAIIKMTLDGKIVMAIPPSRIPDQFKNKADDGRPVMRLTSIAVAPNGDIYAADGYASDYIHRFDKTGVHQIVWRQGRALRFQDAASAHRRYALHAGAPHRLRPRERPHRASLARWRAAGRCCKGSAPSCRGGCPRRLRGRRGVKRARHPSRQGRQHRRHA